MFFSKIRKDLHKYNPLAAPLKNTELNLQRRLNAQIFPHRI